MIITNCSFLFGMSGEDGKPLLTSKLMLSYDASAIMEDDALKFLSVLRNEVENVNETSMGIYSLEERRDALVEALAV